MPVTATATLQRPAYTINDTLTPEMFNGVTLTGVSIAIAGALATDGTAAQTGTQTGDWSVAGNGTYGGTLTVTGQVQGGTIKSLAGITCTGLTASASVTTNTLSVTTNGTIGGTLTTAALIVNSSATVGILWASSSLKVGTSTNNPMTQLAAKTESKSVTLASGASGSYDLTVSSVTTLNGALASTDWPGLTVTRVLSPEATGSGVVRVTVRNDSGSAMTSAGVRFSVVAFKAD